MTLADVKDRCQQQQLQLNNLTKDLDHAQQTSAALDVQNRELTSELEHVKHELR
jgi:hypothetical protein